MILGSCGNPHGKESTALIASDDRSAPNTLVPSQIVIEDAPDGDGSEINTLTLTDGAAVTLYAVSRDSADRFVANISVDWSSTSSLGTLSTTSGTSTTFTPNQNSGTEIIQITDNSTGLGNDSTGNLTLTYTADSITGLQLWLKADSLSYSDNDQVDTWTDLSGNNHHATMATSGYQPLYIEGQANSHPVIRLDGVDDHFDDTHNYDGRTAFIVFRASSTLQDGNELGQLWGAYANGIHIAVDARAGGNNQGFSFDGSGGAGGVYALDNNAFTANVTNSNTQAYIYDQFHIIVVQFSSTVTLNRQVIGNLLPSFAIGAHQYGGDIAEIIIYDQTLSNSDRDAIKDYLNTKYTIY